MSKLVAFPLAAMVALVAACGSTAPSETSESDKLHRDVTAIIAKFKAKDAGLEQWFGEKSYGYLVLPSVGKAGFGVGGAWGRGEVYKGGKMVGYATMTQGTVGLQLGVQEMAQIVFFKDERAFKRFASNSFELGAQASAVAAESGASTTTDYDGGVAVFTMALGGAMAEASVGGQKFKYEAKT